MSWESSVHGIPFLWFFLFMMDLRFLPGLGSIIQRPAISLPFEKFLSDAANWLKVNIKYLMGGEFGSVGGSRILAACQ